VLLSRLSLLFLYRRIFTVGTAWFRKAWTIILLLLCPGWIIVALSVTSAKIAMDQSNISGSGSVSVVLVALYNALLDLAVLILPVGLVMKVQLSPKKKIGLIGIFILGFLGVFASFFRVGQNIDQLSKEWTSQDKLFNDLMLQLAEATIGLICACLPVLSAWPRSRGRKKGEDDTAGEFNDEKQPVDKANGRLAKERSPNGADLERVPEASKVAAPERE
jgi:hypothetical protein